MGMDPISLGIQGVMGYAGGMGEARASRANAALERRWAEYAENRAESDRKTVWGQFNQDKELQVINNASTQGTVQAAAGATGVVTSGGILDVMADSIDRGIGAIQQMRSSALRAVADITNTGNAEVYKHETQATLYDQAAEQSENMAMLSLVTAGLGAAAAGGAFTADPGSATTATATNYSHGIGSAVPEGLQRTNVAGGSFSFLGGFQPYSVRPPWVPGRIQ